MKSEAVRGIIARAVFAAALAGAAAALGACASASYAGIPLAVGAADAELQALARRAQAGDKHAQLELGIRYEEGRGVPRDLARAMLFYHRAAVDSLAPVLVYSPPRRKGGAGRLIRLNNSGAQKGLEEARRRLKATSLGEQP